VSTAKNHNFRKTTLVDIVSIGEFNKSFSGGDETSLASLVLTINLTIVLNASNVHQGTPFPDFFIFVPLYIFLAFFSQNQDQQPNLA
jgi:hypothetical protein